MRILAVPLMLAVVLAGCAAPAPEPEPTPEPVKHRPPAEQYADAELMDLSFTAKDGTVIRGTAYLPRAPLEGHAQADRFGVIVNFSPYYGNNYGIGTDGRLDAFRSGTRALNETTAGLLISHGFAYVAASVPGTGKSGGCFGLGGLQEQTTMAEFIDWLGVQEWSNGNVGMAGGSYDGTTQWMAAIHAPKHLKTIVPHVSITDFYEYEYVDGAPFAWWGPYFLPYYLLLVGWGLDPLDIPPGANPEPSLILEDLCPSVTDHFTESYTTYATGVRDAFWVERDYRRGMANITASVFMVHGLQDWNVKPFHLDGVWDLIPTEKVFWLQQMAHTSPWRDAKDPRPDYNATLLAWYDRYLNGVENGIPGALPAAWTEDQTGRWRAEAAWPPASAPPLVLHLGAGLLAQEKPATGVTTILTPPAYTGAFIEPRVGVRGPSAPDQVVAKFRTEPLAADLRFSGVPELLLNLSVDRSGYPHIVAQLYIQHENGTWQWLDMGARGLAQRDGRDRDDRVQPLQRMQVPVRLSPTETFVPAGARLVLTLSGEDPDWFHPRQQTPTYFIEHGSTLTLPVLPMDAPRGMTSEEVVRTNPYYAADKKQF